MADGITLTVAGLSDSATALYGLAADLRRKVVRAALKDAAKPLIASAKAFAPVLRDLKNKRRQAGTLRKNIRAASSRKYTGADGVIGVFIGVKATKAGRRQRPISGDPFYYRFVEGGHRIVPRQRKGALRNTQRGRRAAATGAVRPYPFLAPAFAQQGQAAIRIFQERIAARVALANAAKP